MLCRIKPRKVPLIKIYDRHFSVKDLSWCRAPGARSKPPSRPSAKMNEDQAQHASQRALEPIEKFGIVAACARSTRIMGISGQLPWNLPEDRKRFMDLTRDRLLIMGRKTYEERPDQSHIAHAYDSIVVSTSMQQHDDGNLRVARSLSEALHMAKVIANEVEILHNAEGLACWVVGGERIFNEALQHRSAEEVHLTLVDIDIDADAIASKSGSPSPEIAYFPAKYRWDRYYEEVSRSRHSSFTTVVYQRTKYSASMPR